MSTAQKYYAILTNAGQEALTRAAGFGETIRLTHMALGDGNGSHITPMQEMTALVNEVYRAPVNTLKLDEQATNLLMADLILPYETGGWTIHELGLYDESGVLFAIASLPPTYKPTTVDGGATEMHFRMLVAIQHSEVIELTIDPTVVLATRKDLEDHIHRKDDPHQTIPAGGEEGQVLIKQTDNSIAWGSIGGLPVGALCFSTTNTALPGTIPVNVKQKFALGVYPQLEAWVRSATGHLTDEAAWDAEAAAQEGSCGKYCLTDTHIILPCYRHYFAAAQNLNGKLVGNWAGDAIRNIMGEMNNIAHSNSKNTETNGVFVQEDYNTGGQATPTSSMAANITFDASRVVPTADENRPKTSYVLPCIKAFDIAVNGAQVDMQALAQQVAAINGDKVDRSEWVELVPEQAWKRPDGMIEQQGTIPVPNREGTVEVTLPVAFSNTDYHAQATINRHEVISGGYCVMVYAVSPTTLRVMKDNISGNEPNEITNVNWFVRGK